MLDHVNRRLFAVELAANRLWLQVVGPRVKGVHWTGRNLFLWAGCHSCCIGLKCYFKPLFV